MGQWGLPRLQRKSTLNIHWKDWCRSSNIWPSDAKSQPTGKVPAAGKDWGQEETRATEDEMVGWHHDSMAMSWNKLREIAKTGKPGVLQSMGSQRVGHDLVTEQEQIIKNLFLWEKKRKVSYSLSPGYVTLEPTFEFREIMTKPYSITLPLHFSKEKVYFHILFKKPIIIQKGLTSNDRHLDIFLWPVMISSMILMETTTQADQYIERSKFSVVTTTESVSIHNSWIISW